MKQTMHSTGKQLIILLLTVIISWIIFSIIGALSGIVFGGLDFIKDPSVLLNNVAYLRYFQLLQSIGIFIIPPIFFTWYYHLNFKSYFQFNQRINITALLITIASILLIQPFISYSGYLNYQIHLPEFMSGIETWMIQQEKATLEATKILMQNRGATDVFINLIVIALVPAIGEELLFRGSIQPLFISIFKNKHTGIWLTAIFFSAIHMQFLGFFPRMFLGALFGYLVVYGRSITLSIIAHFINNMSAVLLYTMYQNNNISENPLEMTDESPNIAWAIISILGVILLTYGLKKFYYEKEL